MWIRFDTIPQYDGGRDGQREKVNQYGDLHAIRSLHNIHNVVDRGVLQTL